MGNILFGGISKRAQVSLFLIIAVVLVLAFGIIYYTANKTQVFIPTVVLPQNTKPVKSYMETCIYDAARQGLVTMGLQGGYLELPDRILRNRHSYIGVGPNSIEKIPHWYYMGENRIPSLNLMNQQLTDHVDEQIQFCKNGLDKFDGTFDITTGEPFVEILFGGKNVVVDVEMQMEIKDKVSDKLTKIDKFGAIVPVRITKIHELAETVMRSQFENLYIEKLTLEMMSGDFNFPFSGMEFKCGAIRWSVSELKDRLMNVLYYNLQRVRVANTDYIPFSEDESVYKAVQERAEKLREELGKADYTTGDNPFEEAVRKARIDASEIPEDMYEYTHMFFDMGALDEGLKVKFLYNPAWDMDFVVSPSHGDVMSSKMTKGSKQYLSFLCMNAYHFAYNIVFPTEVRIVDHESFPGEGGFTFRFGVPVMIEDNSPKAQEIGMDYLDIPGEAREFCGIFGEDEVVIEAHGVYEGYTGQAIPDVNLTYECMNYYCDIGKTEVIDGDYRFKGRIPGSCANPVITASHGDYLTTSRQLTGDKLVIDMEKLITLNVSYEKYRYTLGEYDIRSRDVDVEANESVVLYLSLKSNSSELEQYLQFPSRGSPFANLDFIERGAEYDLTALLTRDGELIGAYVDSDFTVSYADIAGRTEIVIPLIEYLPAPDPDDETEKSEMLMYLYEGDYHNIIRPKFR